MNIDRETIVINCNSQYGRCDVVNKLKAKLENLKKFILADCKHCTAQYECDEYCINHDILQIINDGDE